jgi:hypothetical protein
MTSFLFLFAIVLAPGGWWWRGVVLLAEVHFSLGVSVRCWGG